MPWKRVYRGQLGPLSEAHVIRDTSFVLISGSVSFLCEHCPSAAQDCVTPGSSPGHGDGGGVGGGRLPAWGERDVGEQHLNWVPSGLLRTTYAQEAAFKAIDLLSTLD